MTKEVLKLALEALKGVLDDTPKVLDASIAGGLYEVVQCRDAITAIKEALAQPESDYERGFIDGMQKQMQSSVDKAVNVRCTHPVKDLEDIDINITWNENSLRDFGKDELNFARAILRKAQEK